jgi:hypothetical protein
MTDTFSGIRPTDAPLFLLAQLLAVLAVAILRLGLPASSHQFAPIPPRLCGRVSLTEHLRSAQKLLHRISDRISVAAVADLICLLTDKHDPRRDNVPSFSESVIGAVTVLKLVLGT